MNVAMAIFTGGKSKYILLNKEVLAASQGKEHFVCSFHRNQNDLDSIMDGQDHYDYFLKALFPDWQFIFSFPVLLELLI